MSIKTVVQLILFTLILSIFYVFYFIYFKKNVSEINQSTKEDIVKNELNVAQEDKEEVLNNQNESNIIILDSCRNNPFQFERSLSRGLAEVRAPKGVYISFATQPGNIAEDGSGLNSPYTSSLAKALSIPNLKIEDVFHIVN